MSDDALVIGVVADTHGHLGDDVIEALRGVDLLLHAGDVGGVHVLERLRRIAPLVPVTGNGDPELQREEPWDVRIELGEARILLCHWWDNHGHLHPRIERELVAFRPHALVYGHTHVARNEAQDGVLRFNPGYAGPAELARARSVGKLHVRGAHVAGEIIALPGSRAARPSAAASGT